jgi:hypothetical protein
MRSILEDAVSGYLPARRRFYDELDDASQRKAFTSMWNRHQALDWSMRGDTIKNKTATLFENRIGSIAVILSGSVSMFRPFYQRITVYNADKRPNGRRPTVSLFAVSSDADGAQTEGKADPCAFVKMYREKQ